MRVVLDTNILISALWKPAGLEARVLKLACDGDIVACVSGALWEEYLEVLARPKFAKLADAALNLFASLGPRVVRVPSSSRITWSKDDEDNRVLECAQDACADHLITGNLRHFPETWEGTKVCNAKAFLESIANAEAI